MLLTGPPHLWGGVAEGDGGAVLELVGPPHLWGGVAEGDGGAGLQLSGPWTSNELSASGQVFEFRLWAALTEQSRGSLHVFLPMSDRGLDALVHRFSVGNYIPIHAKRRSSLDVGEAHLVVWTDSLKDDDALRARAVR